MQFRMSAEDLADKISRAIHRGDHRAGQPLPATTSLATTNNVPWHTARAALELLEKRGMVFRRGRGWIVAGVGVKPPLGEPEVFDRVRQEIVSGRWRRGYRLPAGAALANKFNSTERDARAAVGRLEEDKLVIRVGRQWIVAGKGVKPRRSAAQVSSWIRRGILTGHYPAGQLLPAQDALAETYGCTLGAVREAEALLEKNGLVIRQSPTSPPVVLGDGVTLPLRAEEFADELMRDIKNGRWPSNEPLPTQAELATMYGTTVPRVWRGLVLAEQCGLVQRRGARRPALVLDPSRA